MDKFNEDDLNYEILENEKIVDEKNEDDLVFEEVTSNSEKKEQEK